jgi:YebC/PmpR family DNA-binding regulatory protein
VGRKSAKIARRKGASDLQRAQLFTKLIREITVAARAGGPDPDMNGRLRLAVDRALAGNMTRDNIARAIKRASGELSGEALEEVRYEGYAPGGVALMIDCVTNNRTRTVAEVRHALVKHGGQLGADGSVSYLFVQQGVIAFHTLGKPEAEDRILESALETGAQDVVSEEGFTEVLTAPEAFARVRQALEAAGLKPDEADVTWRAKTLVPVAPAHAETVSQLLERLEELDDVQNVYSNAELPESMYS